MTKEQAINVITEIKAEIHKRIDEAELLYQMKDDNKFYAGQLDGLQCALDIIDTFHDEDLVKI